MFLVVLKPHLGRLADPSATGGVVEYCIILSLSKHLLTLKMAVLVYLLTHDTSLVWLH